jgi:hypothetical protein
LADLGNDETIFSVYFKIIVSKYVLNIQFIKWLTVLTPLTPDVFVCVFFLSPCVTLLSSHPIKTRLFAGRDVFWAYVHRNFFLCFHTPNILCKTLDHLFCVAVKCGSLFSRKNINYKCLETVVFRKVYTVNSRLSGGGLTGLRLNRGFFFKFICYLIFIHFCFTWW